MVPHLAYNQGDSLLPLLHALAIVDTSQVHSTEDEHHDYWHSDKLWLLFAFLVEIVLNFS